MTRAKISVLVVTVAFAVTAVFFGKLKQRALRAEFPAPGHLVDIGGYSLHLLCRGAGSPTILFEAGQGESSLTWEPLQSELAKSIRVCAYDRAGYGWSERSPHSRTVVSMVDELQELLKRAEINGPFLLVGHSIGALNMRLFAHRNPNQVIGMVLIDPSHEEMIMRLPEALQDYLQSETEKGQRILRVLTLLSISGISSFAPSLFEADPRLPASVQRSVAALRGMDERYFSSMADELCDSEISLKQMRLERVNDLGDIPLVVVVAGKAGSLVKPIELQPFTPAYNLHAELAAQSSQGQLIIAEHSDHYIHYDEPQVVRDAIQLVLRKSADWKISRGQIGLRGGFTAISQFGSLMEAT